MFSMNLGRTLILNQVTFGDITHQLWERTKIRQKIIITKNYSSNYVLDRIIRLFLIFVNVKENLFTILRHQSIEHSLSK